MQIKISAIMLLMCLSAFLFFQQPPSVNANYADLITQRTQAERANGIDEPKPTGKTKKNKKGKGNNKNSANKPVDPKKERPRKIEKPVVETDEVKIDCIITKLSPYYIGGPQQKKPADGKLAVGTHVGIVKSSGSYTEIITREGIRCFVASSVIGKTRPQIKTSDELKQARNSINQFGLDVLKLKQQSKQNLFFSPVSIHQALTMTAAGADGKTLQKMAEVLHLPIDSNLQNPAFKAHGTISSILNSTGGLNGYQLRTVNRIWGDQTLEISQEYAQLLQNVFHAGISQLDFEKQPDQARLTINKWAAEQTNNKIRDLLSQGQIKQDTRMVLTNAIHFRGTWDIEFSKKETRKEDFHLDEKTTKQVDMMHAKKKYKYVETEKAQILSMPYKGKELEMIVMLPLEGVSLEDYISGLSLSEIEKVYDVRRSSVILSLPKFESSSDLKLKSLLRDMGMGIAFSRDADFSRMTEL